MAIKKSKPYQIGSPPSKYSFEFDDSGKLIGAKKQDENGNFQPVDPSSNEFDTLKDSDQALNAYNVNKFGGNTGAYQDSIKDSNFLDIGHTRKSNHSNLLPLLEIPNFPYQKL